MNCGPIPDRGAVADLSRLRRVNARLSGTVRSLTRDISQARHTIPYAGAVAGDRPGQIQARQRRLRAQCRRRAFATGAGRLLACVRICDTVCRYGGDEFVVMLSQIDAAEDAEVVSDKVSAHLGTPYALGGKPLLATASIGAARCRGDGQTSSELIDRADAAMYFDKVQRRSPTADTSKDLVEARTGARSPSISQSGATLARCWGFRRSTRRARLVCLCRTGSCCRELSAAGLTPKLLQPVEKALPARLTQLI